MRKLINYKLLFLSPFFLAACSNEDNIPSILPSNQPDAVELGITAGVTLTKSVINSGTQADASKDDVMKSVAVYARLKGTVVSGEDPYTNAKSNNYALYTYSTTGTAGWKSGENKKIYLTSEVAKIYAYYPVFDDLAQFSQGLPKIHEHDAKRPQALGIVKEGRLVVLFTLETDLGDGWEDPEVHNDPENRRQEALRMGANIISYVFSN